MAFPISQEEARGPALSPLPAQGPSPSVPAPRSSVALFALLRGTPSRGPRGLSDRGVWGRKYSHHGAISRQPHFGIFFPKGSSLGFTGIKEGTFDIYDPLQVWAECTPQHFGFLTQPGKLHRRRRRRVSCGQRACSAGAMSVLPSGHPLDLTVGSAQPARPAESPRGRLHRYPRVTEPKT